MNDEAEAQAALDEMMKPEWIAALDNGWSSEKTNVYNSVWFVCVTNRHEKCYYYDNGVGAAWIYGCGSWKSGSVITSWDEYKGTPATLMELCALGLLCMEQSGERTLFWPNPDHPVTKIKYRRIASYYASISAYYVGRAEGDTGLSYPKERPEEFYSEFEWTNF